MEFVDHCEITQVHQGAVDQVRQVLPPDEVLSDLADLFKIVCRIISQGMEHVEE